MITWLLERSYQVTGKFKSFARVRKLVDAVTTWHAPSSPGREVAPVPKLVTFVRPLQQYAVRTPSTEHKGGYYYAVVFTSRTDLSMLGVVEHYDGRAGMEADLKCDKHGLALAVISKLRLPTQQIVLLLIQLAHNVLLWARQWLAKNAPLLLQYGIVRLIQQIWTIPGRIKLTDTGVQRVRLRRASPKYTTPLSPRVSGWVTVTHPSHPLCGQQVEILRVRRGPDADLIIRHLDGYHGAIAASWTNYASVGEALATEKPPLLDLEGLCHLARCVEHLEERSRHALEDQL